MKNFGFVLAALAVLVIGSSAEARLFGRHGHRHHRHHRCHAQSACHAQTMCQAPQVVYSAASSCNSCGNGPIHNALHNVASIPHRIVDRVCNGPACSTAPACNTGSCGVVTLQAKTLQGPQAPAAQIAAPAAPPTVVAPPSATSGVPNAPTQEPQVYTVP